MRERGRKSLLRRQKNECQKSTTVQEMNEWENVNLGSRRKEAKTGERCNNKGEHTEGNKAYLRSQSSYAAQCPLTGNLENFEKPLTKFKNF